MLNVGAMYADSYTLAGCSDADHCGVFTRVPAQCTSGHGWCAGGELGKSGETDPTLCDGAPVYQKGGSGSGGPVLFRFGDMRDGPGSKWMVSSAEAIDTCFWSGGAPYLQSDYTWGRFPPAAPAYFRRGWWDIDANAFQVHTISLTAGGGR